jgi:hypothetical protein
VRRLEIERHLVALLRCNPIAELFVERLADTEERLDALLRIGSELRHARHEVDRLLRVALLLVEPREGFERRDVGLVEIDDVAVRVDGLLDVLDLLREHLRQSGVELDLGLSLEGRADVALVGVDQLLPLPELSVVPLEGEVGLLMVGVDLEDLLEALRGEVRLEEMLLLEVRELEEDVDPLPLRGDDIELGFEHANEVGPLLELLVDPR